MHFYVVFRRVRLKSTLMESDSADAPQEHAGQLVRRDGQADVGAADGGDGDADQVAVLIDYRAAAVARIDGAVDLDCFHLTELVLTQARNRTLVDRNAWVAHLER